ncbi:MAG: putative capsular polysaccharide synthesis family protein [Gemmataceae bacterium]
MEVLKRFLAHRSQSLGQDWIGTLAAFVDRLIFEKQIHQNPPVVVYTMPKVGSSSIASSLAKVYPGIVIHTHAFTANHPKWQIRRLHYWALVQNRPIRVISPIREPIGRNVSGFFQTFQKTTGVAYQDSRFSLEELKSLFLLNYPHQYLLEWFEQRIQKVLGIDVYATPFPQRGFAFYTRRNIQLCVLRSELDNQNKERVLRNFLELGGFHITNTNVGEQKLYASTYRELKQNMKPPRDYVDWMCRSRYFRHFYSAEMIENVRRRWME